MCSLHAILSSLFIFLFFSIDCGFSLESNSFSLEKEVYSNTFLMSDGSELTDVKHNAVNGMIQNARRLLEIPNNESITSSVRNSSDDKILKIIFLAVAGNFVVYQGHSGTISQTCSLVINPGSGALVLRDNFNTQSVIMEVLVIVSIICLLRSWKEDKDS
jgi:hypothetical protein